MNRRIFKNSNRDFSVLKHALIAIVFMIVAFASVYKALFQDVATNEMLFSLMLAAACIVLSIRRIILSVND